MHARDPAGRGRAPSRQGAHAALGDRRGGGGAKRPRPLAGIREDQVSLLLPVGLRALPRLGGRRAQKSPGRPPARRGGRLRPSHLPEGDSVSFGGTGPAFGARA